MARLALEDRRTIPWSRFWPPFKTDVARLTRFHVLANETFKHLGGDSRSVARFAKLLEYDFKRGNWFQRGILIGSY